MRKYIVTALMAVAAMTAGAQNIKQLWQQADDAGKKDLPKQEMAVLEKIVKAADKQQSYGNLLKAELRLMNVKGTVSADSLKPAVERLEQRMMLMSNKVQRSVYCAVLSKIYSQNMELSDSAEAIAKRYARMAVQFPDVLAGVKASAYNEVIAKGVDSEIFGNDLLSVIGFTLRDYRTMHDYYLKAGNRRAACIAAKFMVTGGYYNFNHEQCKAALDSLINVYADLDVAGSVAVEKYGYMHDNTAKERMDYLHNALARWGSWKEMGTLRMAEKQLVNPQFCVRSVRRSIPGKMQKVRLDDVRNISTITLNVYKLGVNGDTQLSPEGKKGREKLMSNARLLADKTVTRKIVAADGKPYPDYEMHADSMEIGALPVGVYLLEFKSDSGITSYSLYYVSDVKCLVISPKSKTMRYAVVNATTGQPIAGAKINIYVNRNGQRVVKQTLTTDGKGEARYNATGDESGNVFAYTANDKAAMPSDATSPYSFYNDSGETTNTVIITDRAIYRPGQTVHMAAVVYSHKNYVENTAVAGKSVTVTLYDANRKTLAEKTLTTDEFGKVSTDFALPEAAMDGMFSIRVNTDRQFFRVEEYKRPTFTVEFDEPATDYKIGDTVTVKGRAKSYSGMPVEGARVAYTLRYRVPFWYRMYGFYGMNDDFIKSDTITTAEGGEFLVKVPVTAPKDMENLRKIFCNIELAADVTDLAGETHSAQTQLPLPLRKGMLTSDMSPQYVADSLKTVTFSYLNALGKNIEKPMTWSIDGGKWNSAATDGKSVSIEKIIKSLKSGKHTLTAICEGDTLKHEFTIFRFTDKKPAEYTRSFFYQSAGQFTADGKPVTIMLGSSDKDVHVLYSIISGGGDKGEVLEEGAVDISDSYYTRNFTYRPEYGNGLNISVAWVKDGEVYTHTYSMLRPEPDNKLKLEWTTFRDKLTPGQKEEWTLTVKRANGTAADAQLMATMFDKSLDQITRHNPVFSPMVRIFVPYTYWQSDRDSHMYLYKSKPLNYKDGVALQFSAIDESLIPGGFGRYYVTGAYMMKSMATRSMRSKNAIGSVPMPAPVMKENSEAIVSRDEVAMDSPMEMKDLSNEKGAGSMEDVGSMEEEPAIRENLNETAFFYPALRTDKDGNITMRFTLPEALTTWRFLGIAHTKDISVGTLEGEAVAQKEVMVQPNMPRFIRMGDMAEIVARIANLSESAKSGKATITLVDPMTEKTVFTTSTDFAVESGKTTAATFAYTPDSNTPTLLVCKVTVKGEGFGDGEQHYLPILPDKERVTKTVTFTQTTAGTKTIDIEKLFATKENAKLTVEYADNPAWMVMQALPQTGTPDDESAVRQAASFYANTLGAYIAAKVPALKTLIAQWSREQGSETSLTSNLAKNSELKDIVLNETPWVNDADSETEQRRMLATFFDENLIGNRKQSAIEKLAKLQKADGSWSWMPGMDGSSYITTSVTEMLVRVNAMTGKQKETAAMLGKALRWLDKNAVKEVEEMKRNQKKYKTQPSFPSREMLQYIYIRSLDNTGMSAAASNAISYLMPLLKKEVKSQTMYDKAMTAVILSKRGETAAARSYVQSLKEYTVYREDMGRYYDTKRAGYSWRDYRIPTQAMAIMALQTVTPNDRQTVSEMQRWLLQEKRTQSWDTPLNTVDAIYAFLADNTLTTNVEPTRISIDGKALDMPAATAGIGYRKTAIQNPEGKTLTAEKTGNVTSWGSVYAQFMQPVADIASDGTEMSIKREMFVVNGDKRTAVTGKSRLKVGDKVVVRITVTAARDLDFVQITDRRAACMEPVSQLSGYRFGCYVSPKDSRTNYYFDRMAKGKHVVETEYHIDRTGEYTTGTCTAECAYAPEFRAVDKGMIIKSE